MRWRKAREDEPESERILTRRNRDYGRDGHRDHHDYRDYRDYERDHDHHDLHGCARDLLYHLLLLLLLLMLIHENDHGDHHDCEHGSNAAGLVSFVMIDGRWVRRMRQTKEQTWRREEVRSNVNSNCLHVNVNVNSDLSSNVNVHDDHHGRHGMSRAHDYDCTALHCHGCGRDRPSDWNDWSEQLREKTNGQQK